ncbi:MAG: MBL fold metallo-hydrolase, partial [Deltaproteobacteria bacterium]|nr:MBL fold metallo-hydrolase [Deltaproteobacteria bacterium]
MKVTLTTLCENTSGIQKFAAEWGQSILIETESVSFLFDTGRTNVALANANHIGFDLSKISGIVLSHSHVDHTGGLRGVLQRTGPKTIIAHPAVWEKKYTKRQHEDRTVFNGIPFA